MNSSTSHVNDNIITYSDAVSGNSVTLNVLNLIDGAVDALVAEHRKLAAHINTGHDLLGMLRDRDNKDPIDPEDELCEVLEDAETALSSKYATYTECSQKIAASTSFTEDHKAAVVDELNKNLECINELYDVTADLRLFIMEYDADLSPVTASFDNADDLIVHLHSL